MYKLEEKVFQLGSWSSIHELEDSLTMTELHRLFMAQQEKEYNQRAFQASLKGVDMDPWVDPDDEKQAAPAQSTESVAERVARIKRQGQIKAGIANGELPADYIDPEAVQFEGFGFYQEGEDD